MSRIVKEAVKSSDSIQMPSDDDGYWKSVEDDVSRMQSKRRRKPKTPPKPLPVAEEIDENELPFIVLGFDHDTYFFYDRLRMQMLTCRSTQISEGFMLALMPSQEWASYFPSRNKDFDRVLATNWIHAVAKGNGLFSPDLVRGRGAWLDDGRVIFHQGSHLYVNGEPIPLGQQSNLKSRYVYEQAPAISMVCEKALTAEEGCELVYTAKSFRWERDISGTMLCGWIFLATVCGALKWRPHIWITGGAGSGKTTVLENFARRIVPEDAFIFASGSSSEAGLRQAIGKEARALFMDEFEADDVKQRLRLNDSLVFLRQCSSDTTAKIYRGTTTGQHMTFTPKTMALLASIGVGLEQQQDIERIEVLALKSKDDHEGETPWLEIKARLEAIQADKNLGSRLATRAMNMIPVINEAVEVFADVAALELGSQRNGDQIGALLAGAWCLTHDKAPDREEAVKIINGIDWTERKASQTEEADAIIDELLARVVKVSGGMPVTLGRLVAQSAGLEPAGDGVVGEELNRRTVNNLLTIHGMKVDMAAQELLIHSKNAELLKLFDDTPYANGFHGRLRRVKEVNTHGGKPFRVGAGSPSRNGVAIPLPVVFEKLTDI